MSTFPHWNIAHRSQLCDLSHFKGRSPTVGRIYCGKNHISSIWPSFYWRKFGRHHHNWHVSHYHSPYMCDARAKNSHYYAWRRPGASNFIFLHNSYLFKKKKSNQVYCHILQQTAFHTSYNIFSVVHPCLTVALVDTFSHKVTCVCTCACAHMHIHSCIYKHAYR